MSGRAWHAPLYYAETVPVGSDFARAPGPFLTREYTMHIFTTYSSLSLGIGAILATGRNKHPVRYVRPSEDQDLAACRAPGSTRAMHMVATTGGPLAGHLGPRRASDATGHGTMSARLGIAAVRGRVGSSARVVRVGSCHHSHRHLHPDDERGGNLAAGPVRRVLGAPDADGHAATS
jgi:hypothetical protein